MSKKKTKVDESDSTEAKDIQQEKSDSLVSSRTVRPVGGEGDILFDVKQGLEFAKELAKFIKSQDLTVKIKGHDYVKVEGWQFAGINFGVIPLIRALEQVEADGLEIKYRCEVELSRLDTGQIVGHGFGICSTREASKRTFDEYAIASMAQTRAIGKAYRNLFAWLVKAAGFMPTPAEEMDEIIDTKTTEKIKENQAKAKKSTAKHAKPKKKSIKRKTKQELADEKMQTQTVTTDKAKAETAKTEHDTPEANENDAEEDEPEEPETDDEFELVLSE